MADTEARKQEFLKILGDVHGVLKEAFEQTGVSDALYRYWRKKDEAFRDQCDIIIGSHKARRAEDRAARREAQREEDRLRRAASLKFMTGDQESGECLQPYEGESAVSLMDRHAEDLREALRERAVYAKWLEPEIMAAARVYASMQILFNSVDAYSPVQIRISREGNAALDVADIHEALRRQADSYASHLRRLGLHFDSKVQTKEKDGLKDFMENMMRDD